MAVAASAEVAANAATGPARIGPNAIIRLVEALDGLTGGTRTGIELLGRAGLRRYVGHLPAEMVDEDEVVALHRALHEALPAEIAAAAVRRAGELTGRYILHNRIPAPARTLLRWLPAPLAARQLAHAMSRHAWTFAGSATFTAIPGHPFVLRLDDCVLCRGVSAATPRCIYYAAAFGELFRALVHPGCEAAITACTALGDRDCACELAW